MWARLCQVKEKKKQENKSLGWYGIERKERKNQSIHDV